MGSLQPVIPNSQLNLLTDLHKTLPQWMVVLIFWALVFLMGYIAGMLIARGQMGC